MVLLAKRWSEDINPVGWFCSEKMDGVRAYWNGTNLITRNNNIIKAPKWFTKDFPNVALDGELWAGRGNFNLAEAAVLGSRELDWYNIIYGVFDAPECNDVFESRIKLAKEILDHKSPHAILIPFWVCLSKQQLKEKLNEIVSAGGEGIVIRKPGSLYKHKRSDTMLKVKKWIDAEAVIIGHKPSKANPSMCGALKVMTKDGKVFKVASGMTNQMINNPPPIGTIITYRYDTLTRDGIPRPATFLRIRNI